MSSFKKEIYVRAEPSAVWSLFSDLGGMGQWNNIIRSELINGKTEGIGALRKLTPLVAENIYIIQQVTEWVPKSRIFFKIIDTNMPLRNWTVEFSVKSANGGGSLAAIIPCYQYRQGLSGWLQDKIYFKRGYKKNVQGILDGLKSFLENQKSHI